MGASGDLAPLAHLALAAIGEGEVFYQNERLPSAVALDRAKVSALQLEVKEGLALLNGTQAMGAVGGLALFRAERIARLADVAGAMTLEALRGTPVAFDERIHTVRPHHEYRQLPGDHSWSYWDRQVQEVLKIAVRMFGAPTKPSTKARTRGA